MTPTLPNQSRRHIRNAILGHFTARCIAVATEMRSRRSIMRSLGKLSDHELQDIGLIRYDLEAACSKALSQSAASELETAAGQRSGKW
jgi:uncharacterized protein YjiS (DUF1127 family)